MIEHFVYALLSGDTNIGSLVGDRITVLELPQESTMPALVYSLDEGQEDETFDGQGTFQQVSLELDCWAEQHEEVLTLGNTVKSAIKNYSGTLNGVTVDQIRITGKVTVYETESQLYRQTILATMIKR